MHRHTLFMLLAAFVFWGTSVAFPGPTLAQGPMLARGNADTPPAAAGLALSEEAFTVLFNTQRLMQVRQGHAKRSMPAAVGTALAEDAFTTLFNTERVMLSRSDEDLSRIIGAGPRGVRRGEDAPGEGAPDEAPTADAASEKSADGPLMVRYSSGGPMLAVDDAEGPSLGPPARETQDVEAPDDPPEPAEIPRDQAALYREVRELRGMVEQLREEAEARDRLRITEDEERDAETEILEAAGREYTLIPRWLFRLNFGANYSYNDYDIIRQLQEREGTRVEHRADHTINNTFSIETGVRDNLSIDASIPFVYKYDKVDTAQSKDVTDFGDASVGLKYQPLKTNRGYPSPIFSVDYTFTTGRSPWDINPAEELSTGSGHEAVRGRVSLSHPFDPVNAFGSLSYRRQFRETNIVQRRGRGTLDEVRPGDQISASLGFGYAVSYRMSMSLSLSSSYRFSTEYYWLAREGREKTKSGDSVSASMSLNTSWRVTPGRTVIIGFGKGLTTANPGFSLSVRMPFSLDLR